MGLVYLAKDPSPMAWSRIKMLDIEADTETDREIMRAPRC